MYQAAVPVLSIYFASFLKKKPNCPLCCVRKAAYKLGRLQTPIWGGGGWDAERQSTVWRRMGIHQGPHSVRVVRVAVSD